MDDEFGFYEGDEYTLSKFEKKARDFSEKWFPERPTPEQVEEEFWRIVETAEDSVKVTREGSKERRRGEEEEKRRRTEEEKKGREKQRIDMYRQVDYGSDLDVTKIQRSGFPRDRADGVYITDDATHWNLNRLPRMRGSVLSHIKETGRHFSFLLFSFIFFYFLYY